MQGLVFIGTWYGLNSFDLSLWISIPLAVVVAVPIILLIYAALSKVRWLFDLCTSEQ